MAAFPRHRPRRRESSPPTRALHPLSPGGHPRRDRRSEARLRSRPGHGPRAILRRNQSQLRDIVIRFAGQLIRGLRDRGVIPCGKHFPGHGDTAQDSHLELPVVKKSRQSLHDVELPPFIFACGSRIECLMTAHVLYAALDPAYPATLSEAVVGSLLREEMGYQGVVFADDLEMKAISKNFAPEEAVSRAVDAGLDVLLFCHNRESAVRAFEFLYQQAEKNARTKARIEESYQRIRKLKTRYLKSFKGMGEDLLMEHVGITSHQKLADEIIKAGEH
ncbi:MAG: beta-N-acetylhexosaminidase [Deltaproteobacteria bacterium]|nr:beta-N-acetylhexosaminidase [Deltaproteobacteria bacterium]